MFYREELLASRPTLKLEEHPLSAVHDYLFNLFAATFHKGGRSYILNLRKRHAVVTGTHYTWIQNIKLVTNKFKLGGLHEKHVVARPTRNVLSGGNHNHNPVTVDPNEG